LPPFATFCRFRFNAIKRFSTPFNLSRFPAGKSPPTQNLIGSLALPGAEVLFGCFGHGAFFGGGAAIRIPPFAWFSSATVPGMAAPPRPSGKSLLL